MPLTRVTITGADESVSPHDLLHLSRAYPFCEWGILVSAERHGQPRFPSTDWVHGLQALARATGQLRLALHVCGRWTRQLLGGYCLVRPALLDGVSRVQLNFGATDYSLTNPRAFFAALQGLGPRQLIFQLQGQGLARTYLGYATMASLLGTATPFDCVPLFDASSGRGLAPPTRPRPHLPHAYPCYGYAGGLRPATLPTELPRILAAAGAVPLWIDLESGVRSHDERQFDLTKVQEVLALTAPFVDRRS